MSENISEKEWVPTWSYPHNKCPRHGLPFFYQAFHHSPWQEGHKQNFLNFLKSMESEDGSPFLLVSNDGRSKWLDIVIFEDEVTVITEMEYPMTSSGTGNHSWNNFKKTNLFHKAWALRIVIFYVYKCLYHRRVLLVCYLVSVHSVYHDAELSQALNWYTVNIY